MQASRTGWRNPGTTLALFCALLATAGCAASGEGGGPEPVFVGAAAVDEPRAAVVARDILGAGGSAVDAAGAAYFALAATMPARAGLGGGGACLVFNPTLARVEAVDFMARPAAGSGSPVPMNARGFFVLHGRYGKLRWEQVVAPGEALAKFGVPLSRAAARDLADNAARIAGSPDLARVFRPRGGVPREGEVLAQPDLAATLGAIRMRGANDLHAGATAQQFMTAARAAGAGFDGAALAAASPQFRAPLAVSVQDTRVSFLPPPSWAGIAQAQMWQMLAPRWSAATADQRQDLVLDAQARALGDAARWTALDPSDFAVAVEASSANRARTLLASAPAAVPGTVSAGLTDAASTSIVVADRDGGAVACTVSLGAPFGSGRIANGVVLAAAPDARASALSAVMATRGLGGILTLAQRADSSQFIFAGAGSGAGAAASLVAVGLGSVVERAPLDRIMARPRRAIAGDPPQTLGESGSAAGAVAPVPALGRLNAISCPDGRIDDPTTCRVHADPRGDGLAVGGVR